ncbi:assimilatory sulfite reductase (NADPH) hemoprotein subunit [Rhodanobacter glycinis]|uniref:Sulfite reductase [NADPH] hemoprotein beta-component n=1 Tax=Rhodanobacter glycinis TaxID=582702 RepID=A0A1I3YUI8_9GAMM|nr:assimilatory sulfite reductase (NADPH) hemoprotein subunit [Rhodanobacter glycinis]SFK35567.1 sulfite reductase (NADPH) beta subunit [Rhodanobacter glycinis]
MTDKPLSAMEQLKADSRYLRGTIAESLANRTTGAISDDDTKLLKFHGSYMQDDRDLRDERRRQKLEPDYQFMVRVRLPGGVLTPRQWLDLDQLARAHASSGLRITTRQTFQFHGIAKEHLRDMIGGINDTGLSTLAACGDDVRNVICSVNPRLSPAHAEAYDWALRIMRHLEPRTSAYKELWVDKLERTSDGSQDSEPLLGKTYLPRKFKIGIAIPPYNDIDVFAQDLGLIAILDEHGQLAGFNLAPGGSMGASAGNPATYPQLGDLIGFVEPGQILDACWHAIAVQRDFGDRVERLHARLKYTIDDRGLDWYRNELQSRLDFPLQAPRDYHFEHNGDRYGWTEGSDGRWHLTLQIPSGRLLDTKGHTRQTGLRDIARMHTGEFRMTCDQNVIIADVAAADRAAIDALVEQHGLDDYKRASGVRQHAIACVALPTCGLAMAESERYLPTILDRLETVLDKHGLRDEPIHFRMSGCPNGCSRPYLGEIALIGRAVGRYDLRLGADHRGERLNALYRENIDEAAIVATLDELFGRFASERQGDERFGDFIARTGVVEPPRRRPALDFAS